MNKNPKRLRAGRPAPRPRFRSAAPVSPRENQMKRRGRLSARDRQTRAFDPANGRVRGKDRHRTAKTGNLRNKFIGFGRAKSEWDLARLEPGAVRRPPKNLMA